MHCQAVGPGGHPLVGASNCPCFTSCAGWYPSCYTQLTRRSPRAPSQLAAFNHYPRDGLPIAGTSPPGRPGTRGTSQDLDHWLDLRGHTTTGWESHNPRYRSTSSGVWRRHCPKDTYRNPTKSSACSVSPAPPVHLVILSFTHSYSPSLKYTHSILTQTFVLVLTI